MTTSVWNDSEVRTQFGSCANLKEIIVQIENDFASRGEVVCEIKVNGMILDEGDESHFAESKPSEINDLVVKSERPEELIKAALTSAFELVPQLEKAALLASDALRGANLNEGRRHFADVISGCQWLVETLTHIRGAATGIGRQLIQADLWESAERSIMQVVIEVSAAYEKSDLVLVADLLEYELTKSLEMWSSSLRVEIGQV